MLLLKKKKVFTEYAQIKIPNNFEMYQKICIYIQPVCKKKNRFIPKTFGREIPSREVFPKFENTLYTKHL